MKIEISQQTKNELFGRTEIVGKITFEGATPKRTQVLDALAKQLKTKPELVVVKQIATAYGGLTAKITGHAYEKREQLEKIERTYMQKRNEKKVGEKPAEEAKPEAKKTAEAEKTAAEKPTEEKPTEKPAEEAAKKE